MHYTNSVAAQALARVAYVLSGTIVFVVLARLLGPTALGVYVYAINLITIAGAVADLGSTGILARDLVASGPRQPVYLANFVMLRLLLGGTVGLLCLPVAIFASPEGLRPILVICSLLMPLVAAKFYDPVFQVTGRPWISLWHTGGYGAVQLAIAAAIALWTANPVPWLVLAYALTASAYGIIGFLLTLWLMPPNFRRVTRAGIREVMIAVGPFGLGGLFSMLAVRLDVFLVASLGNDTMVGQYNAAFRFIDLGAAVIITVLMPLVTVFAHLATENRHALVVAWQSMMRFVATWCTAMAVLAPTVSALVVRILYGDAFAPAGPVLDLLAWKFQIAFCNMLCFALLMTVGSIRFTWWNTLQALGLNLALNALLIPPLGIVGSGIASIASEVAQTIVNIWFLARAMGNIFDLRWWRRLAAAAAATAVVVHLPLDIDPLWLLAPGLIVFVTTLHLTGGLPGNPLAAVRHAETTASPISHRPAA